MEDNLIREDILNSCHSELKLGEIRAIFSIKWLEEWKNINQTEDENFLIDLSAIIKDHHSSSEYRIDGELILNEDVLTMPVSCADWLFAKYEHKPRVYGKYSHPNVGIVYCIPSNTVSIQQMRSPLHEFLAFDGFEVDCSVEKYITKKTVVLSHLLTVATVQNLTLQSHNVHSSLYHVCLARNEDLTDSYSTSVWIELCGKENLTFGQIALPPFMRLYIQKKAQGCTLTTPENKLSYNQRKAILEEYERDPSNMENDSDEERLVKYYAIPKWWVDLALNYIQGKSDSHPGKIPPLSIYPETQKLTEHQWKVVKKEFGCVLNEEPPYIMIEKPRKSKPTVEVAKTPCANSGSIQKANVAQEASAIHSSELSMEMSEKSRPSPAPILQASTPSPAPVLQASPSTPDSFQEENSSNAKQMCPASPCQVAKATYFREKLYHTICNISSFDPNSYKIALEEFPNFSHVNAVLLCLTHLKRIQNYFLLNTSPLFKDLKPTLSPSSIMNGERTTKQEESELNRLMESFVDMLVAFRKGVPLVYSHFDLLSQLSLLHSDQLNIQRADVATFFKVFIDNLDQFLQFNDLIMLKGYSFPTERTTSTSQRPNTTLVTDTFEFQNASVVDCSNCKYNAISHFPRRILSVSLPPVAEPFKYYLFPIFSQISTGPITEVCVFLDPRRTSVKHLLALTKNYMPAIEEYRWKGYLLSNNYEEMVELERETILENLPKDKLIFFYESDESSPSFAKVIIEYPTTNKRKKNKLNYPPLLLPANDSAEFTIDCFMTYLENFGSNVNVTPKKKENQRRDQITCHVKNFDAKKFNLKFYDRRGVIEKLTEKSSISFSAENSVDLDLLLKECLEQGKEDIPIQCEGCKEFVAFLGKPIPIPIVWPPVLVIHLNRFPQSFTNFPSYRNPLSVICPERLAVSDFINPCSEHNPEYQLVAYVSLHDKAENDNNEDDNDDNASGVFSATCRVRDRTKPTQEYIWYRFQNCEVKEVKFDTKDAVLLFYEDISDQASEDKFLEEVD